jgi:hypothetical protein
MFNRQCVFKLIIRLPGDILQPNCPTPGKKVQVFLHQGVGYITTQDNANVQKPFQKHKTDKKKFSYFWVNNEILFLF